MISRRSLIVVMLVVSLAGQAGAVSTTFTLDPDESWLQLSAQACTCGEVLDFEAQSLGSLIARYDGTMRVDLTSGSITFQEAQIDAKLNGLHNPGHSGLPGQALGNYGARLRQNLTTVLEVALRSISFDLRSPVMPLNGNNFGTPGIVASIDAGQLDYRETNFAIFPVGHGDVDLAGRSASNASGNSGTLLDGELIKLLRVPMLITFELPMTATASGATSSEDALFTADAQSVSRHLRLTFQGQLQGTYRVPEPGTGLAFLFGVLIPLRPRRHGYPASRQPRQD